MSWVDIADYSFGHSMLFVCSHFGYYFVDMLDLGMINGFQFAVPDMEHFSLQLWFELVQYLVFEENLSPMEV